MIHLLIHISLSYSLFTFPILDMTYLLTDAEPAILRIVMQFASTASKLVMLDTKWSLLDTIGQYQRDTHTRDFFKETQEDVWKIVSFSSWEPSRCSLLE
jgi:hypothetical protein